ncbi:hypothetical protein [Azospirillum himalayense]|uniref:Uncharacterized protein n=1 Tax=Azospirillum himalayense TaxID=654847 RepID=A0ABW0GCN1_9PROT
MMPWVAIAGGLFSLYAVVGFFISINEWDAVRKYYEQCQSKISAMGTIEEKIFSQAGFISRNNKGLLDIALKNLSIPEKILLLSTEPNLLIEANRAHAGIEKQTGVALLEQKYCSDIKRP